MTKSIYMLAAATLLSVGAGVRGVGERRGVAAETKTQAATRSKKAIDPEADRILRRMTDRLAGLQSFTVETSAADEVTLKSGQKIQTMSASEVAVERPNHLRSIQRGGEQRLGFFYDGKTMTLACKANNTYQTAAAPPTIDATIDRMRKEFRVDAPAADLLDSRPYDVLTEQVVSGRFIGLETVDGVSANHIAFQGEEVDWQLWIQDGDEPLPLRFVITSKTVPGRPEFAVQFSNWNTQPKLAPWSFDFQPPGDAKVVPSVVASCGAAH